MIKPLTPGRVILLLMTVCLSAHGQILNKIFNEGDVYAFEFTLPAQPLSYFGPTGSIGGSLDLFFNPASVQPGDTMRIDMFENALSEAPICSGIITWPVMTDPVSCSSSGAWQDLQGAVRFTMVSGSITVDAFQVEAYLPS